MSDLATYSNSLQYGEMKRRAISARSYRNIISSSNSTSFTENQTIQIDLPGNMSNTFYNFQQLYFQFTVTSDTAYFLDRCGAYSFIKRLQMVTAGSNICDLPNYNVLMTAIMDLDASSEWKAGIGNIMMGTVGDALNGASIGTSAVTYSIPLLLNPLSNPTPHKLLPGFSLSSIRVLITLDSLVNSCVYAGTAAMTFTDCKIVAQMTELSSEAMKALHDANSGRYNILCTSWSQSGLSLPAAQTSLSGNVAFSVSSLERLLVVQRPSATVNISGAYSLGNRGRCGLDNFSFLINGEQYPQRVITVTSSGSEVMAELLLSSNSLVDFNKGTAFQNAYTTIDNTSSMYGMGVLGGADPSQVKNYSFTNQSGTGLAGTKNNSITAATESTIGTFLAGIDLESAISHGKGERIYSGISTLASSIVFSANYTAPPAITIDVYGNYTTLLSLDMNGTGVFSLSV